MRGGEQKKVTSLRLLVPSLKLETLEKEIGGRKINKGHVVFWWSMNHQQYCTVRAAHFVLVHSRQQKEE